MAAIEDFTALCDQARQHLKHREFDKAIETYMRARQIDDDRPELHEALATAYILTGKIEAAIEHLVLETQLAPRKASAFVNLGALYNRIGDHHQAVIMCRKAVAIDRKSADGYYNLGFAHRKLNQLSMAVPAYREAIRINPKFVEAHQNLGNVCIDMGNLREAIIHFRQALEIDPQFEKARIGLERAEELKAGAKIEANPFGRLVDIDKAQSLALDPAQFRVLTEEEREADRRSLHLISLTIGRRAKDLRDLLKSKLNPQLTHLEHELASQVDCATILEQFQPIAHLFQNSCHQLEMATQELRIHERRLLANPRNEASH